MFCANHAHFLIINSGDNHQKMTRQVISKQELKLFTHKNMSQLRFAINARRVSENGSKCDKMAEDGWLMVGFSIFGTGLVGKNVGNIFGFCNS